MPHTFPATDSVTCLVGRTRGRTSDADPRGNAHKVRGVIRTPLAHPAGHGGIGTQWPCARHTTRRIEVGIVPGRKDRLGSRALLHPTLQSRLQVVFRISLVEADLAETVRSRAVLAVLHPGCKKQADQGLRPVWTRSEEHTSELLSLRHLVCRLLL